MRFDPSRDGRTDGLLTIQTEGVKADEMYTVREFDPDSGWDGRAFSCHKVGKLDPYHVFVSRNGQDSTCDCATSVYRPDGPCKHVLALLSIVQAGLIPHPAEDPRGERAMTPEEMEEMARDLGWN
jgi:hypothetical protein